MTYTFLEINRDEWISRYLWIGGFTWAKVSRMRKSYDTYVTNETSFHLSFVPLIVFIGI